MRNKGEFKLNFSGSFIILEEGSKTLLLSHINFYPIKHIKNVRVITKKYK